MKDFDLDFAYQLGRGLASMISKSFPLKNKLTVAIGRDARLSSVDISGVLSKGFTDSGFDVLDLGLVTSPMTYFSTFQLPIDGAVQITGSHNPPEYNGFKICVGKNTIFGKKIIEVRDIIQEQKFISGSGSIQNYDISTSYLEKHTSEFGMIHPIPVVLDCGNGAAGIIVRRLFEACGLKPHILFEEPDGTFPNHHPDPTVEHNLKDLQKAVIERKAICGIGFDGDADRIGVVNHEGRMIYGDELMVLFSRNILKSYPGSPIVGDVKCSDRLYKDIEKNGGQPIMWLTGHSLIKEKIKDSKAPFGGEMSGHIFFADRNYGYDDAPYAALRLCEIISRSEMNIDQLLSELPPAFNTPEIRIDTTEEKKHFIVEKMKAAFPSNPSADYKVNLIDGIRISFDDGWALCRSSNTQPVLVLRYESSSSEGLKRIQKRIEEIVKPLL